VASPRRRKRYRYRLRRLTPVVVVAALAGIGGAWAGHLQRSVPSARIASPREPAVVGLAPAVQKVVRHQETLLSADNVLAHTFSPGLLGKAAILVDASDGRVLWQLHPHRRLQVASTTKIMTALLALRRLQPHDIVTVDKSVPRVPLVREGLRAGERVEAWKLFYAMLLYSGNDDALALAIAAGGTKWHFVHQMNTEARILGLHDTHFVSPSGVVDVGNYSSAWDLAALTRVALRNERFRSIVRTKVKHVAWTAPTYSKIYVNNNRLLRSYPGANGVKTGYTHKAGPCLVASATRGGTTLIAVVLDSPDMYTDTKRLLDLGFASLG
jgi:serine-type D-Ala-D-Ala carboxypeptidase (penicillin-binding protein 5/6)